MGKNTDYRRFLGACFFYPNLEPLEKQAEAKYPYKVSVRPIVLSPFSTIVYDISKSLKKMTIYVMTRLKYSYFIFVYLFKEEKVFRLFR